MFDVLLFDGAEVFGFSWCEVAGLFILSILFGASVGVVGFFGTASVVGLRLLCFNLVVRAENGAVVVLGDGDNLYVIASRVRFRKVVGVRGTAGGERERPMNALEKRVARRREVMQVTLARAGRIGELGNGRLGGHVLGCSGYRLRRCRVEEI